MTAPTARWSRRVTRFSTIRSAALVFGWGSLLAAWLQGHEVPAAAFVAITVAVAASVTSSVCDWQASRAQWAEIEQQVAEITRSTGDTA